MIDSSSDECETRRDESDALQTIDSAASQRRKSNAATPEQETTEQNRTEQTARHTRSAARRSAVSQLQQHQHQQQHDWSQHGDRGAMYDWRRVRPGGREVVVERVVVPL